jgi:ABC-type sugar transport system substrate-binding protein
MKRLGLLLLALGLAGGAFATAHAATDATRTICHRTSSAKNPYVKLRVSAAQLRAHLKHAADHRPRTNGLLPAYAADPELGWTCVPGCADR